MPAATPRETTPCVEPTLYAELVRRGLPADYARRTAEELDDHRADLLADLSRDGAVDPQRVADERLGETRVLAKRIARDYRRRTWLGRHPVACYVLAPIPLWVAALIASNFGIFWLLQPFNRLIEGSLDGQSEWARMLTPTCVFMAVYVLSFAVLPSLISAWMSRLALRTTQLRRWAVCASVLVGVAAASLCYDLRLSTTPGESSFYMRTPRFGPTTSVAAFASKPIETLSHYFGVLPLAQLAGPLLAGALAIRSEGLRRREALLAPPLSEDPLRLAA